MADGLKIAGTFELKSVILYSYDRSKQTDIKNLILGFSIIESMSKPSIRGSTTVFDSTNIMTEFPLRGEEFIEFKYADFYDNERIDTFFVYSISDLDYPDPNNPTLLRYTLNYVSAPKMLSDSFRIMMAFNSKNSTGLISDYVKDVYNQYYKTKIESRNIPSKELVVEETEGLQDLVVPNLSPEETLLFFSRKAYNGFSRTQTYRFFENRDSFYFSTNDNMETIANAAGTPPIYTWNYMVSQTAEDQEAIQKNLIKVQFGEKVNTANDIREGAYKKYLYEIDLWNGTVINMPPFDFLSDFYSDNQETIHTRQFIEDNVGDRYRRFVLKDWASANIQAGPEVRNNTYMTDLYGVKTTYFYHYRQNSINVSVYGDNRVVAGSVVQLTLYERRVGVENPEVDMERSGLYFVESAENIFYENSYVQNLTLARYGNGAADATTATLPTTTPAPVQYSTPTSGAQ